ncbi:MAG: hypothetical protein HRT45_11165, partial [Bdellovibrionales bacterium]|nr:hypothetical protein [Bdellovibrionales bacterium]
MRALLVTLLIFGGLATKANPVDLSFLEEQLVLGSRPMSAYRFANEDLDDSSPGRLGHGPKIASDISHDLAIIAEIVRVFVLNVNVYREVWFNTPFSIAAPCMTMPMPGLR